MKKVGFVLKGYPRVSETFIAQEIYLLEQRGFEIEIISLRDAREKERQPIVGMIRAPLTYVPEHVSKALGEVLRGNTKTLLRYPLGYLSALTHAVFSAARWKNIDALRRFAQAGWLLGERNPTDRRIEHLHSHFVHAPTEFTYYVSRISGIPYTISAHAKDVYTLPQSAVRERVENAKFLMTCTGFNVSYIRSIPGITQGKVHQVYHGIDVDTFIPGSGRAIATGEIPGLVSVGRIVAKKGYEHILQALRILRDQGVSFTYDVYGTGDLDAQTRRLAQELGLEEFVRFHGVATQPVIIERLRKKGIFVCGSQTGKDGDRDGIPNTIAEAMSMELPIVATRVSGIPELVQDGVHGLLVDEQDPQSLARAIRALIANPDLADKMGKAGRAHVSQAFNSHRCIDVCERLLRGVLA